MGSVRQRQADALAVASTQVHRDQQFQRLQSLAAIGLGVGFTAQGQDDVVVVQRVAEAVDRGGLVAGIGDLGIHRVRCLELPVLDLVDRQPANTHRAALTQQGDRALEVFRVGQHADVDRAHRAIAPFERGHPAVLDLDVARQGARVRHHALDRADDPVQQIDVVAGLVHEGASIELPGAAPCGAVVVALRPAPEHVDGHVVQAAETALRHRPLEQLQRRVAAVLLDNEKAHTGIVTGLDHRQTVLPAGGHRLFRHHMQAGARGLDGLLGVQAARGGQHHAVDAQLGLSREQLGQ
mmetsp:Transcript_39198/g.92169  ORF Transcript_39198/g.92169 Transcript_39198/m.92169 type:complete len:295 (+) Transcript_39198:544-1428(+)